MLLTLEGLGFCNRGEAGAFVADGRTRPGGSFPLNTSGGGLSYCHPGMFGIFLVIEAVRQLRSYFGGQLRRFDLPLYMRGTPFQLRVWRELERIPYGETRSYRQIAAAIGAPRAVRAVGAANGANPIPIVVPCHRVIGASGKLVGYGGGLPLKKRLLELEGARALPLGY